MTDATLYAQDLLRQFPLPGTVPEAYSSLVAGASTTLISSSPRKLRKRLERTPVVFLGARDLDATSIPVPGRSDEALVLIGPRFPMFLHMLARAGLWAALNNDKVDDTVTVEMGHALTDFFAYLLLHRSLERLPYFMGQSDADVKENEVVLLGMCLGFAIAHEFAHVSLGHLGQGAIRAARQIDGRPVEVFRFHQLTEIEADREGARLLYASFPNHVLRDAAPLIFCAILGALDHLIWLTEASVIDRVRKAEFGRSSDAWLDKFIANKRARDSHPHGKERFDSLLSGFRSNSEGASDFARYYERFLVRALEQLDGKSIKTIDDCAKAIIELRVSPSLGLLASLDDVVLELRRARS
jgi:hypothetical protein